jgi:hypothetical protein
MSREWDGLIDDVLDDTTEIMQDYEIAGAKNKSRCLVERLL